MFELKIIKHFAAAHMLNLTGRKCENLHGHNWKIEVFVIGEKLDHAGVLVDFGIIKKNLKNIINGLDHKFLNESEPFSESIPPSSENIARHIGLEMDKFLKNDASEARVSKVTAWESHDASATWINNF